MPKESPVNKWNKWKIATILSAILVIVFGTLAGTLKHKSTQIEGRIANVVNVSYCETLQCAPDSVDDENCDWIGAGKTYTVEAEVEIDGKEPLSLSIDRDSVLNKGDSINVHIIEDRGTVTAKLEQFESINPIYLVLAIVFVIPFLGCGIIVSVDSAYED